MPNLGFYLSESADRYPHAAALRCEGVTTTHSQPRRIWFVDGLPTGPTGKVLHREVQPPPLAEG